MLRRNLASEFVAGAYVFPGGSVDPEDRGPRRRPCARGGPTPRPAPSWAWSRAAWPSGWPPCGSASRRPASWWPDRPGIGSRPGVGPARHHRPGSSPRFAVYRDAVNEQRRAPRHLPARRAWCWRVDSRPLRQPLDHPRVGPPAVRHPVLHHRGPARPDRQPRRRGDHRHHLDPADRGTGPPGRRRDRAAAPDHRQSALTSRRYRTTAEVMAWARQVTNVPTVLPIVLIEDGQRPHPATRATRATKRRWPTDWPRARGRSPAAGRRVARQAWVPGRAPA